MIRRFLRLILHLPFHWLDWTDSLEFNGLVLTVARSGAIWIFVIKFSREENAWNKCLDACAVAIHLDPVYSWFCGVNL